MKMTVEEELVPAMPALFDHCTRTYEAMLARSIKTLVDGEEAMVYEGFITRLVTGELNLAMPYYTKVTRALKAMDCIRQIKRGGSSTPSQWLMVREPTEELFRKALPRASRPTGKTAQTEQQISDLRSRVNVLESNVEALIEAMQSWKDEGKKL